MVCKSVKIDYYIVSEMTKCHCSGTGVGRKNDRRDESCGVSCKTGCAGGDVTLAAAECSTVGKEAPTGIAQSVATRHRSCEMNPLLLCQSCADFARDHSRAVQQHCSFPQKGHTGEEDLIRNYSAYSVFLSISLD